MITNISDKLKVCGNKGEAYIIKDYDYPAR